MQCAQQEHRNAKSRVRTLYSTKPRIKHNHFLMPVLYSPIPSLPRRSLNSRSRLSDAEGVLLTSRRGARIGVSHFLAGGVRPWT